MFYYRSYLHRLNIPNNILIWFSRSHTQAILGGLAESTIEYYFTKGCPQGSCLKPSLWIPSFKTVFQMHLRANCLLIVHAGHIFFSFPSFIALNIGKWRDCHLKIIEERDILNNMQISVDNLNLWHIHQFSKFITRILKTKSV